MALRFKAAEVHVVKAMTKTFKNGYFDGEKEQYKMAELSHFISTITEIRNMAGVDQELAAAMAGAKI